MGGSGIKLSLYLCTVTINLVPRLSSSFSSLAVHTVGDKNLDESMGTRLPLLALYPANMDICGLGTRLYRYMYRHMNPITKLSSTHGACDEALIGPGYGLGRIPEVPSALLLPHPLTEGWVQSDQVTFCREEVVGGMAIYDILCVKQL